ncbi:hypothetical protein K470DRAFT_258815 [Piedraia hortae CBS 480.64]|uniref:Peptidase M48 domain-containing protein n=1 Tax=Piedraia hortae CBS 480.64 TaxID=1314780 RepID=A0A6A7BVU6_9PEZI|nr:hypothetical protein K470DRAFT_258815 [Piedraia hortae CBS 480.64]
MASKWIRQSRVLFRLGFRGATFRDLSGGSNGGRRSYYRQPFNYQRFTASRSLLTRWSQRKTFYREVTILAVIAGGGYTLCLEEVPVSYRHRFNIISPSTESSIGKQMSAQIRAEYAGAILPESSKEYQLVSRVLKRLLPYSGLGDTSNWTVTVINDPNVMNAMVVAGGQVFVFRGILNVANDEDTLAAVLGHEIAHNVARHTAERLSKSAILLPMAIVGSLLFGLDPGIGQWATNLVFTLPGSRQQESEADYIGLMIMAKACYDPHAALRLWQRFEKAEQRAAPPQFMSTHPSNHNRLEKLKTWMPKAEESLEESGCGNVAPLMDPFRKQVGVFAR